MINLAFEPALSLASSIRQKEISSLELLELYLRRVEAYNPQLNAVIFTQLDKARERAKAADGALARGEVWGPLHGVPMTIKESFDWIDSPSTWGNPVFKDNYPQADGVAVRRLQSAGAIIFGKTNVPLMLGDWQSFNDIYGTTNNPWDLTRVPGGSSGGAAAALAAGLTGLELGSDIGASIRNPAHYCGIFGHKPTYGIVPTAGHGAPGDPTTVDIGVGGPMARTASDLRMGLDIVAGAGGLDAVGWRLDLPEPRWERPEQIRAAVMLESPCVAQDDELTEQLAATVESLAALGVQIDDSARPDVDIERSHDVYMALLRAATGTGYSKEAMVDQKVHGERYAAGDRDDRAVAGRGSSLSHWEWAGFHREREQERLAWAAFFEDYDLLLCPTAASAAYPHDHSGERADRTITINGTQQPTTDQLFWAGWSCGVYLPGTVVPAGLTRSGLPCGLQIVAPHLQDYDSIAFAGLMERELGGYQAPPGYD